MLFLTRSVFNLLVIVLFLCAHTAVAADDAYLEMLEGEAEDLSLDRSGQLNKEEGTGKIKSLKEAGSNSEWGNAATSDVLPSGMPEEEFPAYLKKNFYGTYVFYRKLNAVDKRTIYYHYSKNESADIDTVREDILGHLKK